MEIKLAESIRTFRKERGLTQEQLAEVLGVTAGAVYKWEAGLSTPELPLIVEMADFFDTAVDVLLGYTLKDNRIDATAQRLLHCQRSKDLSGLEEAEKALKKTNRVIHRIGIGKGTEVLCAVPLGLAHFKKTRIAFLRNADIRILLVIAKQDVVMRSMLFNEIGLQHQGFDLVVHDDVFEMIDMLHHSKHLWALAMGRGGEIGPHTPTQRNRLPHINNDVVCVTHEVHARRFGQSFQFL